MSANGIASRQAWATAGRTGVAGVAALSLLLTGCAQDAQEGQEGHDDRPGQAAQSGQGPGNAAQSEPAHEPADEPSASGSASGEHGGHGEHGQEPAPAQHPEQGTEHGTGQGTGAGQPRGAEQTRDAELCTAADLRLALGEGHGTAGTLYRPLQFTNVGAGACTIQGFAGVSYVAGEDGHQVGAPAHRTGAEGGTVTLASGETAHADVGFVQVRNFDPAVCDPTPARGLRVYPPQETSSMFVPAESIGCASAEVPGHQLTVATMEAGRS